MQHVSNTDNLLLQSGYLQEQHQNFSIWFTLLFTTATRECQSTAAHRLASEWARTIKQKLLCLTFHEYTQPHTPCPSSIH